MDGEWLMKNQTTGSRVNARPLGRLGAAIAVSSGVGGVAVTNAVVSTGEKAVFIPIAPCRLFDLRPAPASSWPALGSTRPQARPMTQQRRKAPDGRLHTIPARRHGRGDERHRRRGNRWELSRRSIRPTCPHVRRPRTSTECPARRLRRNKVDTKLSADGKINLFNLTGSVSVLADVVGYYADHNHDDRYYTKAEIDTKLNSEIVMSNDVMLTSNSGRTSGQCPILHRP